MDTFRCEAIQNYRYRSSGIKNEESARCLIHSDHQNVNKILSISDDYLLTQPTISKILRTESDQNKIIDCQIKFVIALIMLWSIKTSL